MPVAHHHPVPVLVQNIGGLLTVGGDVPATPREHLPGTVPDQLIQQATRRVGRRVLRSFPSNYRGTRAYRPTDVGASALLELRAYRDPRVVRPSKRLNPRFHSHRF